MKHKIAVIGAMGNMGSRYCSILTFLKVPHIKIDLNFYQNITSDCTGIIIATPTDCHYKNIFEYARYNLPILCEKPICKKEGSLREILEIKPPLRMINQYEFLLNKENTDLKVIATEKNRRTYYNYFKSGKDGLYWDCINIIGMSNQDVKLGNDSPVWDCWINGNCLAIETMDEAYIDNISDWLEKYDDRKDYIKAAHAKIFKIGPQ